MRRVHNAFLSITEDMVSSEMHAWVTSRNSKYGFLMHIKKFKGNFDYVHLFICFKKDKNFPMFHRSIFFCLI